MGQLKEDLYIAFYWYFRREYASVADFVEKENGVKIYSTKNAEIYAQNKIEDLIRKMEATNYE